ncbi:hypothetical protein [Blastococcus sp. TF02-09]|uniref:hypothetical protein n=1 Tax=Blastococcus sp. TF02-09 TaxID=2250576 RepID=UPI001F38AEF0|nr:hypothetical protein [Blastococcus sp. TF02-9]
MSAALLVLVAGCTDADADAGSSSDGGTTSGGTASSPVAAEPGGGLTVVADEDPVAQAVTTSRALFESSPVAVLVRADDRAGQLLGASAAVGLGVPLLVEPARGGGAEPAEELDRLGVDVVLAVGEAEGPDDGPEVRSVPADVAAVAGATGLSLDEEQAVPSDGDVAAVAELDPDGPVALRPEDAEAPEDGVDAEELPEFDRADPVEGVVLLAGDDASPAAVATGRAAGARVVTVSGSTDPRASADVVEALSDDDAETVIAVGAGLGAEQGLDWKVATAATGTELPGGGQLLFPGRMMVALYGFPGSGALGVLGEQPVDAAIQRARDTAAPYDALVEPPVVPAFEVIVTVASEVAGPDGNYSTESPIETVWPWVEAAGAAGLYVILDLQPGRTDFVAQAELYRPLLELPHVGLALDPEWRLAPGEVHLTQIGSVGVEEVNRVVTWLADLTRERSLPQKLLVLHQFRLDMLPGREDLDLSRDELAVLIHADGQGSQASKQETWRTLRQGAPEVAWGWKNFYDEDAPMLTPEQTIQQVLPTPELVSYQ